MLSFWPAMGLLSVEPPEVIHYPWLLALLLDPTRLVLLIVWFYLCMYCVLWIQSGTMVPDAYKTPASLMTLVTGPVLPLVLIVIAAVQRSRQSQRGFLEALSDQLRGALVDVH